MTRPFLNPIAAGVFLALFAIGGRGAETNSFVCQTITLPVKNAPSAFADLRRCGRSDLLAIDPLSQRLLIYRQGLFGFTNAPDQVIELPPHTAWIAPYPVESSSNLDLLMSTAAGLVYYRQSDGRFETGPHTLIQVGQVFLPDTSPALISLATNAPIPVVSATQSWLYRRNEASEWTSGPPVALSGNSNGWSGYRSAWTLGQNSSSTLDIRQSFQCAPVNFANEKPENETIARLITEMKRAGPWNQPGIVRLDLNRDGRSDFILWQVIPDAFRTDVYVFLRGADGKLPERPSQILHCRGVPIPVGSAFTRTPIGDLKGDGICELVLLDPSLLTASASGLVDMLVSRGVDMDVTVRTFNHGAFAPAADRAVSFKSYLSWTGSAQWPFFICGDFNGDGRPDLVVMRSSSHWEIYFSTNDGHWFQSQPAMTFELPVQGNFERRYFETADLNGDGRSDLVSHGLDDPRLFIFLTRPETKGNP